jgi:hypothetical protein
MEHARSQLAVLAALAAALGAAGCGASRQDADEPSGRFHVRVTGASFPSRQSLSESARMRIEVRNADKKTLPNVAVTVRTKPKDGGAAPEAFGVADTSDARLADSSQPIWIVDSGPKGGASAYTDTWALGSMFPGETKTFDWRVLPVRPGDYTITYRVSPGLDGKAKPANGERTRGSFRVTISGDPVPARVDDNGNVVRGEEAGRGGGSSSSGR